MAFLRLGQLEQAAEQRGREVLRLGVRPGTGEAQVLEQLARVDVQLDLVALRRAAGVLDPVVVGGALVEGVGVARIAQVVGRLEQLRPGGDDDHVLDASDEDLARQSPAGERDLTLARDGLDAALLQAERLGVREQRRAQLAQPVRASVDGPVGLLERAAAEVARQHQFLAAEDLLRLHPEGQLLGLRLERLERLLELELGRQLAALGRGSPGLPGGLAQEPLLEREVRELPEGRAQVGAPDEEVDVARDEHRHVLGERALERVVEEGREGEVAREQEDAQDDREDAQEA